MNLLKVRFAGNGLSQGGDCVPQPARSTGTATQGTFSFLGNTYFEQLARGLQAVGGGANHAAHAEERRAKANENTIHTTLKCMLTLKLFTVHMTKIVLLLRAWRKLSV
jgi:hypothetical protein